MQDDFGLMQIKTPVIQIPDEKALKIEGNYPSFTVVTNKNSYTTKIIVVL